MCLNPITIVNPTKYLSPSHRERFLLTVKCGKCAECQKQLSDEWYFRSWHEFMNCVDSGGYVLFDTLTYDNAHLPHLSRFMDIPKHLDYPCFDFRDYQKFIDNLRIYLSRCGYDVFGHDGQPSKLRYFITSEYGTSDCGTHRPHYHILFFVAVPNLSPLVLSAAIGRIWHHGRTDGIPYKSSSYVTNKRVYRSANNNLMSVCRYVSKYVQKDCKFQREIDRRITSVMVSFADGDLDWIHSSEAKKIKASLVRQCSQFHKQSKGFGASVLSDIDLAELVSTGMLAMPDKFTVVKKIPLPMYYKRKLFYELVEVDGVRMWQLTDLGKEYVRKREVASCDLLEKRLNNHLANHLHSSVSVNTRQLAEYIMFEKGRLKRPLRDLVTVEEKLSMPIKQYSYCSASDFAHFGQKFVTFQWLGNRSHYVDFIPVGCEFVKLKDFIDLAVVDERANAAWIGFDHAIDLWYDEMKSDNDRKQSTYEYCQELHSRFKRDFELEL